MTNAEIIKSLKECSSDTGSCKNCPRYDSVSPSCIGGLQKDAVELIEKQNKKIDKLTIINKLHESDIANRDEMLKQKVEVVYADFMRDYKCIQEELDGVYKELADQRAEIERLQKALISINYIAKRIPQAICDNTYPDFDKNGHSVNVWKAIDGYTAINELVEQITKEAMS